MHVNSQELATSLFEEMTLGRQRAIMAVAAVIAPEAGLSLIDRRAWCFLGIHADLYKVFVIQEVKQGTWRRFVCTARSAQIEDLLHVTYVSIRAKS